MISKLLTSGIVLLAAAGLSGCAQTHKVSAADPDSPSLILSEQKVDEQSLYRQVTEHQITVNGQPVSYKAISGETFLRDMAGEPVASIFSFSYLRTDVQDKNRPVVFVFNGGPGSSSVWLHMGAIGPRRVVLDQEVNPSNTPPFGLTDNPNSILDVADLVFIDPVGTGFSRALNGTDPQTFWGVDEDAESIAQFIELWISEHGRWNSPKYLLGESYGSMRAAVLPRALMGGPIYTGVMRGITVDGIILLGTTLDGRSPAGVEPAVSEKAAEMARSLPGLAVTSAYHGLTGSDGRDAEAIYAEAVEYARTVYEPALREKLSGTLSEDARRQILQDLERLTGVSAEEIGDDLYIDERSYAKSALKPRGLEIGLYDSRYTLPLANSGGDPVADDPAMTLYVPGFIAAFHEMLREDLNVRLPRPYGAIVWKDLLFKWDWERAGVAEGQSFATDIAWSMRRNPKLRVFVASGIYDLVTTPADARASLAAANLPEERVVFSDYESGHMLYLGGTSKAFSGDLRAFLQGN